MTEINVLDSSIFNRIAAGEVVERPASIVKELVENSIDAGADRLTVEIRGGGIEFIRVSDNGKGMSKEDMPTAFLPHATSKIKCLDDLNGIGTLGFRGEALPSIASVAAVTMTSRRASDELGYTVKYDNGALIESGECGCPLGTSVTVEHVFRNIPAREKFLGKPSAEAAQISDLMAKLILANYGVSIRYTVDGKEVYHSAGEGMESAVYCVYGKDVFRNLDRIEGTMPGIVLKGFVNKPAYTKHNRSFQTLIVNGRYVSNADVAYYVYLCYQDYLMKRQYPMYVLYLDLPYDMVDVNVHPNKLDVKFAAGNLIKNLVMRTVKDYLYGAAARPKELTLSGDAPAPLDKVVTPGRPFSIDEETAASSDAVIRDLPSFRIISRARDGIGIDVSLRESDSLLNGDFSLASGEERDDEEDKPYDTIDFSAGKSVLPGSPSPQPAGANSEFGANDFADLAADSASNEEPPKGQVSLFDRLSGAEPLGVDFPIEQRAIGKLFNTYIIVEEGDSAYFIDQHAAHEKLLYDKLVAEYNSGEVVMQDLLVPYVFEVTHAEGELFESKLDEINRCGFAISPLGGLSFSLSAVPLCLADLRLGEFVPAFLAECGGRKLRNSDLLKDTLMQTACKAAVKGLMNLDASEINGLLEEMRKQNLTLFCPHGRPIVIKILKSEIEKWFKRIV